MADLVPMSDRQRQALVRIQKELERDPRLQSAHTRRAYLTDLKYFEEWRQGRPLTKLLVEEYAAQLHATEHSPNSINRVLASVRWWARRVSDLAFESPMPEQDRDEIVTQAARVASIQDVVGERQPKGRHIANVELESLLAACRSDPTAIGARDAAIVAVAWSTGLRRSEIAGLNLEDWQRTNSQQFVVRGKGNKTRQAYLTQGALGWLRAWIRIRGAGPGPLVCPITKGGKVQWRRRISAEGLANILAKRSVQAGVKEHVTWHDFRRTFAGNLLDSGIDLATVQKLLGHSSPVTTSNYDRRGESTKQRAVRKINIPFWPEET
jgi:site-specific recombinase XerD